MSVHNGRDYLAEAIDSVLGQTFADFEFLIVDDGSIDGSAAMLEAYAARDDRVHVISQANQGLTRSLNTALALAKGEFIARFDADDVSLPDRFQRQVTALRLDPDMVLLGTEVELITHDGLRLGIRRHAGEHDEIRRRLLLGDGGALTHPVVMMRRSAVEAVGGYDESFPVGQDLDLFLRLTEVGKAANLAETLLLWRQHDSSVNRTRTHLWQSVKTRAIENTINRVGASEYAKALFYEPDAMSSASDPLALGAYAASRGRYRSAARLYALAMKAPTTRGKAAGRLFRLITSRAMARIRGN